MTATTAVWEKWKASDPTSPHWYTSERQQRLVAAQVRRDADNGRDRTVREFVTQFRGLPGTEDTFFSEREDLNAKAHTLRPYGAMIAEMQKAISKVSK